MSAEADLPKTASDSLQTLQQTLRQLISSAGLNILPIASTSPPQEASLHPLSTVPLAHVRRQLDAALETLKSAAQARESWDDDKADRLLRVKHDAISKRRAVNASKGALEECARLAVTSDPFASRCALALQRLCAVAEEAGATTDKTAESGGVLLTVCGSKFIADFTFSDITANDINVKVNFRYLTETDNPVADEAVSAGFASLVQAQEFDTIRAAFVRLVSLERLNASIPDISLVESLRAFEDDLLAANEIERKGDAPEYLRPHGAIERTPTGLRITFMRGQAATLGVEDAASPVTISAGRSQLTMKELMGTAHPVFEFTEMKTASVPACYVLTFESPKLVCLSVAQALERVGGGERSKHPRLAKASGGGRELFSGERVEEKPHWPSLQKLLVGGVFGSEGSRPHWSLTATEFVASVSVPDGGYVEFSHSGNDVVPGLAITRVPICFPQNVKPVLALVRQQLVFNELFTSCFGETVDKEGLTQILRQPVEVVLCDSPSFMQFSLYDGGLDDIVSMAVSIQLGGEIGVVLKTSDGRGHACSDAKATAILRACRSVPLTIVTIAKMSGAGEGGEV